MAFERCSGCNRVLRGGKCSYCEQRGKEDADIQEREEAEIERFKIRKTKTANGKDSFSIGGLVQ